MGNESSRAFVCLCEYLSLYVSVNTLYVKSHRESMSMRDSENEEISNTVTEGKASFFADRLNGQGTHIKHI